MSQSLNSIHVNSPARSDTTLALIELSSTNHGDTGSIFKVSKAANQPSQVANCYGVGGTGGKSRVARHVRALTPGYLSSLLS
jgi:hypothetical protein